MVTKVSTALQETVSAFAGSGRLIRKGAAQELVLPEEQLRPFLTSFLKLSGLPIEVARNPQLEEAIAHALILEGGLTERRPRPPECRVRDSLEPHVPSNGSEACEGGHVTEPPDTSNRMPIAMEGPPPRTYDSSGDWVPLLDSVTDNFTDRKRYVIKTNVLVALGAAVVGALTGLGMSGIDGVVPGVLTAETGLVVNILSARFKGAQRRKGPDLTWQEEFILKVASQGTYSHVEIARRTELPRRSVLAALKSLNEKGLVRVAGQLSPREPIWAVCSA